jgi:tetratricopeptide (TPR) repeat protein/tRNA A-37 threonylcarbamoyl transferase component Bud32
MVRSARGDSGGQTVDPLIASARAVAERLAFALDGSKPSPDLIPGYEILSEIHSGAQGVVYLAMQKAAQRRVAIKVMRDHPFGDSHGGARFEREVHILAQLRHPNIVAIHDSGRANGRYYFVMDYIAGEPLDRYMARADRPVNDSLKLFGKICDAFSAAHLRGVVHRDCKPGNIRVDNEGEPHVLDFGLARMDPFAERSHAVYATVTDTGQFVGSVPWASPEQAGGSSSGVDIRTDVYSLGVVLFQMLTGEFPYPVAGPLRTVLDHIVHTDPKRPSSIRRQIDNELETIILKALSKEPERRYQSAGELARDVQHYLKGEAIEAKRDSAWYVLRKSAWRHKGAVAAITAVLVLLSALGVVSVRNFQGKRRILRLHEVALAGWMIPLKTVAPSIDPDIAVKPDLAALEQLEQRMRAIEGDLRQHPADEADLRTVVGIGYLNWSVLDKAAPHLERALEIRRELLAAPHEELATGVHNLAALYWRRGAYDSAEPLYREALAMRRELFGEEHVRVAESLNHLGACLTSMGEYAEAEVLYRAALAMRVRLLGPNDKEVAQSLNNLATCLLDKGDPREAEPLLRQALDLQKRLSGENHEFVARGMTRLADGLTQLGQLDEAERLLTDALGMKRMKLDAQHPSIAVTLHYIGEWQYAKGALDSAEETARACLSIRRARLRPDHPDLAATLTLLGRTLIQRDELAEAEKLLFEALKLRRQKLTPGHWRTAETAGALGDALAALERYEEAEPLLVERYQRFLAVRGDDDANTRASLDSLVRFYELTGDKSRAEEYRRGRALNP